MRPAVIIVAIVLAMGLVAFFLMNDMLQQEFCAQKPLRERALCLSRIAVEKTDSSICGKAGDGMPLCYHYFKTNTTTAEQCLKRPRSEMIECLSWLAARSGEKLICTQAGTDENRCIADYYEIRVIKNKESIQSFQEACQNSSIFPNGCGSFFAIRERKPALCPQSNGFVQCIFDKEILKTLYEQGNVSLCNLMGEPYNQLCMAVLTNPTLCSHLSGGSIFGSLPEACYAFSAIIRKDLNLCNNLSTEYPGQHNQCVADVAIELQNMSICLNYDFKTDAQFADFRSSCILFFASATVNASPCRALMPTAQAYNRCIQSVALRAQDQGMCELSAPEKGTYPQDSQERCKALLQMWLD